MKSSFLYKNLWHHIAPRRRRELALLLMIMVFTSFAEVVSIGAVLPFLGVLMSPERVFEQPLAQPIVTLFNFKGAPELLLPLTMVFIVAALLSGAMRLILLWAELRLSYAIGADFSFNIYKKTLYQPYLVHVARNSSNVIATISMKTNAVVERILLPLLRVISSSLILVTIIAVLVFIDPFVALIVFGGFGFIYLLILLATKKRLARYSQRISVESNLVIKALQEGLGGIRDILIDGTQEIYCKIYREADLPLRRSQADVAIIGTAPRFLIESLGMTLIAVLAYGLVEQGQGISNAIPVLGALAIGAQRMLPVMQQLYGSWSTMGGYRSSLSDVLELLNQPLPCQIYEPLPPPINFNELMQLNGVGFKYTAEAPWTLREIDLEIRKGARVGFMGMTGSGKSTMLDLIMGLLTPTEGSLMVDGVAITSGNYRAWQANIGHVPQVIYLADATIGENIAFGISPENIDYELVRSAARQAQIADTIESWAEQYDTIVGEQGIRLSGGQRQRIGIARAFYKQAEVIIFDEATSALDNETEQAVMESIESMGKNITILIVAHRLTTMRNCDCIVELEQGRVKWAGNYSDIISR